MGRAWMVPATVVRVIDADTIEMDLDLGWHLTLRRACRLLGLNAPEANTPEGKAATEFARSMLPAGTVVQFNSFRLDKYGRPLGQIIGPQGDYGRALIMAGHAVLAM
jgi:micrococcal nuclease